MSELHPITIETLRELINVEWFRCVGVNDIEDAIRTTIVDSWEMAMDLADTIEWSNLRLDAANTHCSHLMARNPERFRHWNDVVRKVKPYSEGLVEDKAGKLFSQPKLRSKLEHVIRWDMLHLLMECEYADVYPPGWFASQAYWYRAGHFPCGWEGEYPQGRLIIF